MVWTHPRLTPQPSQWDRPPIDGSDRAQRIAAVEA